MYTIADTVDTRGLEGQALINKRNRARKRARETGIGQDAGQVIYLTPRQAAQLTFGVTTPVALQRLKINRNTLFEALDKNLPLPGLYDRVEMTPPGAKRRTWSLLVKVDPQDMPQCVFAQDLQARGLKLAQAAHMLSTSPEELAQTLITPQTWPPRVQCALPLTTDDWLILLSPQ